MTTLAIFGNHDEQTLAQLADVDSRAVYTALMADGHVGYIMPIGGVAAYDDQVSVAGVGFDIACGNLAIQTDLVLGQSIQQSALADFADHIAHGLEFGIGRTTPDGPVDHPLFASSAWDALPGNVREPLRERARAQIGTIGSGNHYVDIFAGEDDALWVGVHFGSRGLGHTIASGFMSLAAGRPWGERVPELEALLDLDSDLGQRYWALMELTGRYAYAGREWVAGLVVGGILGARARLTVHNHHNYAWRESHFGRDLVVVRKGATPAFPGQQGFVGGSMGDDAVILQGSHANTDLQRSALYSTVHGAGRIMSRTQAKGSRVRTDRRTGERTQRKRGAITRQMMSEWTRKKGVIVRGGDVDESPHVYRRLDAVLAEQGDTIEILHRLRPLIVVMAGADVRDPYKD